MTTDASASAVLAVTYRPIDSLVPDPRNARTHPKRQLEQIIASIREFGFTNPILIDPDGGIIAGHGRLLAAKAIGMGDVPTIELGGLSGTKESELGFRLGLRCASHADAHRNIFHGLTRGSISA